MTFRGRKDLLRPTRRPSVAGNGLLERMRSTTFALFGGAALFGLVIVALMSQQGFGLLPPLPIPGLSQGEEGVSGAAAVSRPGDSVSAAVPAPVAEATGVAADRADGSRAANGRSGLAGSDQIGSPAGDEQGGGQPGQPAPQPSSEPVQTDPTPTTVSQPTTIPPSSSDGDSPSTSTPAKTDAGTAAVGGSTTSGNGQKPPGKTPDSVKQETKPVKPPPATPVAPPPSSSGGQTDAEKAEAPPGPPSSWDPPGHGHGPGW